MRQSNQSVRFCTVDCHPAQQDQSQEAEPQRRGVAVRGSRSAYLLPHGQCAALCRRGVEEQAVIGQDAAKRSGQMSSHMSTLPASIGSARPVASRSRASTSRCGRESLKVGVHTAARALRSSLSKGSRGAGRDRSGCSEEKQPDEKAYLWR